MQESASGDFNAGDECLVVPGSELGMLANDIVAYRSQEPVNGGVECPTGTGIKLSYDDLVEHERQYQAFEDRREEVTAQTREMDSTDGRISEISLGWVKLVNAEPVGRGNLTYGEICISEGPIQEVGELATGEIVWEVTGPRTGAGSHCPEGAQFINVDW